MGNVKHPNIIVVVTDTFRRDNICSRSNRKINTPILDRFATERAIELTGLTMSSFPTIPHRTDFASGRLGWPHYGWQAINRSTDNHIASLLAEQGYFTQLICDTPHLFNAGFQTGFHGSFQHQDQEGSVSLLHMDDPIKTRVPHSKTRISPIILGGTLVDLHGWSNNIRTEAETFSARTALTTTNWLERNYRSSPFFLWVDFFDPHEPWDPPEYLVRHYDPDYTGIPMLHPNYGPADRYTNAELHNLWAHYAAESELVDRHIGLIIQKLDDLDLWKNSLVIIMSDHGISIGEHNQCGKSNITEDDTRFWPLYPELSNELCLVAGRGPEGPLPKGLQLDLMAQPTDLLPTLCELADVQISPPEPLHGRSFAQQLMTGTGTLREHVITGAHLNPERISQNQVPSRASTPFLRSGSFGYAPIGPTGTPQLFDLNEDPFAEKDIAPSNIAVVSELHELFLQSIAETGANDAFLNLWTTARNTTAGGSWARDYST